MADIVNLNRYRKQQKREAARKSADENRARFGRSKSELGKSQAEAEKAGKELDDKRLE